MTPLGVEAGKATARVGAGRERAGAAFAGFIMKHSQAEAAKKE